MVLHSSSLALFATGFHTADVIGDGFTTTSFTKAWENYYCRSTRSTELKMTSWVRDARFQLQLPTTLYNFSNKLAKFPFKNIRAFSLLHILKDCCSHTRLEE